MPRREPPELAAARSNNAEANRASKYKRNRGLDNYSQKLLCNLSLAGMITQEAVEKKRRGGGDYLVCDVGSGAGNASNEMECLPNVRVTRVEPYAPLPRLLRWPCAGYSRNSPCAGGRTTSPCPCSLPTTTWTRWARFAKCTACSPPGGTALFHINPRMPLKFTSGGKRVEMPLQQFVHFLQEAGHEISFSQPTEGRVTLTIKRSRPAFRFKTTLTDAPPLANWNPWNAVPWLDRADGALETSSCYRVSGALLSRLARFLTTHPTSPE